MTGPILRSVFRKRYEISDERLAICKTCDRLEPHSFRCKECGCFMDYKTLLPYVSCPLGKWNSINSDEDSEETNDGRPDREDKDMSSE
jgi:hypothetical protein